jgi:hypothetical protein
MSPPDLRSLFDRWIAMQDPRPPRPKLWSEEDLANRRIWLASIEDRNGVVEWPDTWPGAVRRTIQQFLGRDDVLVITFPSEIVGENFRLRGYVFRHTSGAPMIVENRSGAPNVYPITFGPEVPLRIELVRDDATEQIYPARSGAGAHE